MLDTLVSELASRFGVGEQASALVRQTLDYIQKTDGGASGFLGKFEAVGLGGIARSWLGGMDGAQDISPAQMETALGNKGGLIAQLVDGTGLSRQTVTPALCYTLPRLIGALSPEGSLLSSLPAALAGFMGTGTAAAGAAATAATAAVASGGSALARWIPWLLLILLSLLALGWCSKQAGQPHAVGYDRGALSAEQQAALQAQAEAAELANGNADANAANDAATNTDAAATEAASAPEGAGVVGDLLDGSPRLKVYFDTGKAEIAADFDYAAAGLVQFAKEQAGKKLIVSGFADSTGNAALNAALSKERAEAVRDALVASGIALERIELVKPQEVELNEGNLAEARRVEVTLQ